MTDEKRLREELNDLLRHLKALEQESKEKSKQYEGKDMYYLEGVCMGEEAGYYLAASMLETVLICNNMKGKED